MDKAAEDIVCRSDVERLRAVGFVIVPLRPTEDMMRVGAPNCFIVPDGTFEIAMRDAADCYAAMIELGCL